MTSAADRWRGIEAFCLFVGYGRSGHSVVGSLIDAHPHAAIAHELHAVKRYFEGVPRDVLFDRLFALAQAQARDGRRAPRADGGTYLHHLEGQAKPGPEAVRVIGDKKGAGTAWQFSRLGLDHLERFRAYLGVPLKMVHVIRNPFDVVAAGEARGGSRFAELVPVVAEIRRLSTGPGWLDVYHEDVIADPEREMARVLGFLGLPAIAAHLERCRAHVFAEPHRRRLEMEWPAPRRAEIETLIARHDFLGRYTWNS